jgi:catecholate siderophore receptor
MKHRTPIASALLAIFSAPAAWAQDSVSVAAAALPDVTVRADGGRDRFTASVSSNSIVGELRDTPQSVIVINKALLQSQGASSLADAVRNVPGITLGGAEGGQIGNNINLNGFSARTDLYLDGFRDRGQYYRDTFALDSVEVLMGPSSMLFGRGSTGGAINQVTKKPSLTQASEFGASVTTSGLVRTTLDHNQPLSDTAALRVSAMAQDGKPTTRDEMKNRDLGIAPSLTLGIDTPTEITLSALLQHNRDMPDYGVSPLNGKPVRVDRNNFYGFTDDRLVQDVVALSARIQRRLSPTVTLRSQLQYNDVRVNAVETASQSLGTISANGFAALVPVAVSALPLDQLGVRLQSHDRIIHDKSLFNQTELNARFDAGSTKHNLIVGTEFGHDSYLNQGYYRNGSCRGVALNPVGGTSGYVACEALVDPAYAVSPAVARDVGNLASSAANTVAAYANDTMDLGQQFKLVGGLRYDQYQAHVANSIQTATVPARTDQTVHYTSVRLGGLWQPTDAQSYYLSYSTSFNPSLEQLTVTTGATQPLPPEQNRAHELGGKWDLAGGKVALNAAVFQITKYNARDQAADGTYTAAGTIRVKGARLGASGQLARGWKLFAGYAYLDGRIVDGIAVGTTGKVPLNTPRQSATLWSTYELTKRWEVGGGANYLSSRFLNNTNLVHVDSYARFDATVAFHQPRYDIRLNLFNLANKYYYENLIASDGGRAVPGTGRSAMLSFVYHL